MAQVRVAGQLENQRQKAAEIIYLLNAELEAVEALSDLVPRLAFEGLL